MMNLLTAPPTASAPFLGQSFRILLGRSAPGHPSPPFVHPEVIWSACELGSECIRKSVIERPDLVLLEPGSAIVAALQLCRSLRSEAESKSIRIAVWSPGLEQGQRLEFYQAGADDIVTEGVMGSESIMRLTSDARRVVADKSRIAFADLVLFPDRHLAWRRGKSISLSGFQLKLLHFLMQHPDIVFSREELSHALWQDRPVNSCSISTAMNRLRHLLSAPDAPDLIQTVRGIGYVLQAH